MASSISGIVEQGEEELRLARAVAAATEAAMTDFLADYGGSYRERRRVRMEEELRLNSNVVAGSAAVSLLESGKTVANYAATAFVGVITVFDSDEFTRFMAMGNIVDGTKMILKVVAIGAAAYCLQDQIGKFLVQHFVKEGSRALKGSLALVGLAIQTVVFLVTTHFDRKLDAGMSRRWQNFWSEIRENSGSLLEGYAKITILAVASMSKHKLLTAGVGMLGLEYILRCRGHLNRGLRFYDAAKASMADLWTWISASASRIGTNFLDYTAGLRQFGFTNQQLDQPTLRSLAATERTFEQITKDAWRQARTEIPEHFPEQIRERAEELERARTPREIAEEMRRLDSLKGLDIDVAHSAFLCGIHGEILVDPVFVNGNPYERKTIMRWVQQRHVHAITGEVTLPRDPVNTTKGITLADVKEASPRYRQALEAYVDFQLRHMSEVSIPSEALF